MSISLDSNLSKNTVNDVCLATTPNDKTASEKSDIFDQESSSPLEQIMNSFKQKIESNPDIPPVEERKKSTNGRHQVVHITPHLIQAYGYPYMFRVTVRKNPIKHFCVCKDCLLTQTRALYKRKKYGESESVSVGTLIYLPHKNILLGNPECPRGTPHVCKENRPKLRDIKHIVPYQISIQGTIDLEKPSSSRTSSSDKDDDDVICISKIIENQKLGPYVRICQNPKLSSQNDKPKMNGSNLYNQLPTSTYNPVLKQILDRPTQLLSSCQTPLTASPSQTGQPSLEDLIKSACSLVELPTIPPIRVAIPGSDRVTNFDMSKFDISQVGFNERAFHGSGMASENPAAIVSSSSAGMQGMVPYFGPNMSNLNSNMASAQSTSIGNSLPQKMMPNMDSHANNMVPTSGQNFSTVGAIPMVQNQLQKFVLVPENLGNFSILQRPLTTTLNSPSGTSNQNILVLLPNGNLMSVTMPTSTPDMILTSMSSMPSTTQSQITTSIAHQTLSMVPTSTPSMSTTMVNQNPFLLPTMSNYESNSSTPHTPNSMDFILNNPNTPDMNQLYAKVLQEMLQTKMLNRPDESAHSQKLEFLSQTRSQISQIMQQYLKTRQEDSNTTQTIPMANKRVQNPFTQNSLLASSPTTTNLMAMNNNTLQFAPQVDNKPPQMIAPLMANNLMPQTTSDAQLVTPDMLSSVGINMAQLAILTPEGIVKGGVVDLNNFQSLKLVTNMPTMTASLNQA